MYKLDNEKQVFFYKRVLRSIKFLCFYNNVVCKFAKENYGLILVKAVYHCEKKNLAQKYQIKNSVISVMLFD
jgi:hypothetical protein